ncbi:TonB-dependent hemoglobin/transferrin/lactoferrin family receptor [Vibrio sp. S4M6]|uniref:TonB-dependent hemoglobin/transferrin/lactoferrin family receptor n=1 Tax=Vibrio sinus TaxID=2946865 RepID=UPI00202A8499|nr:TonB-dependent hemoglobin/transferrin/lactoferrin family receptor [Vibrio sinus]MCL9780931.1 TonB-dependent hemoglobin/transferrin/lactoferrin family receptor [Vibrio sinus]
MNRRKITQVSALVLLSSAELMQISYAATNSPSTEPNNAVVFDAIEVSATREDATDSKHLYPVDKISQKQLEQTQPQSVAEALKYQPNLSFDGGPRPSAQEPIIRGLSDDRVLQVIDGARQTYSSGHTGTYLIDPSLVNSIEVLKGPGSAIWGSGAIGGVVAITTKSPEELLEKGQNVGGYVEQSYQSVNQRWLTNGAAYGKQDNYDWLFNGYYSDSDNVKDGNGTELQNSSDENKGFLAKTGIQLTPSQRIELSTRYARDNQDSPIDPSAAENANSNYIVGMKTDSLNATVNYKLDPKDNDLINTQGTLYYNDVKVDSSRTTTTQNDTTRNRTLGLSAINHSKFEHLDLSVGTDGYQEHSSGTRDRTSSSFRPIIPDATTRTLGVFSRVRWSFAQDWTLQPALRYDYWRTNADYTDSNQQATSARRSDSALSPSAALSWQTTHWLQLTARYDEAFRAPTSEELYTGGYHFPGNEFVPNPNLEPEKAKNKEIDANMAFGDLLGDDELTVKASVFRNDVDDFINTIVNISGGTTTFQNVGNARLTGYSVAADYKIHDTSAGLSYGQVKAKSNDGSTIDSIPANKWVAHIDQGFMDNTVNVGARVTYTASTTQDSQYYGDYTITDIYSSWNHAFGAKPLTLRFGIDNLTNQYYIPAPQTLAQPGRNFKLSARYTF